MSTIPTIDNTKYLPVIDFCKRYNEGRPESMKLEPSFVKLLCEQKSIEHSILPSHDGRKNDVYMIPEYELEKVDIILNGDTAVKEEPDRVMDAKEVATFLGIHRNNVAYLVRKGKLKARKIHNPHGGADKYEFDEDDVLKYKEEHPKRPYTRHIEPKKAYIMQLEAKNNELMASNASYADLINSLRKDLTTLEEEKANWLISSSSSDKDIFEAYRRGFKDGFEMGGKK